MTTRSWLPCWQCHNRSTWKAWRKVPCTETVVPTRVDNSLAALVLTWHPLGACFGRKDDNTWDPSSPPLLLINAPLAALCSLCLLSTSDPQCVGGGTREVQDFLYKELEHTQTGACWASPFISRSLLKEIIDLVLNDPSHLTRGGNGCGGM